MRLTNDLAVRKTEDSPEALSIIDDEVEMARRIRLARQSLRMHTMAITKGWNIPDEVRERIIHELKLILQHGTAKDKTQAASVFVKMMDSNIKIASIPDEPVENTASINMTAISIGGDSVQDLHTLLEKISGMKPRHETIDSRARARSHDADEQGEHVGVILGHAEVCHAGTDGIEQAAGSSESSPDQDGVEHAD
jgi:hypothetical protein